MSKRDASKTTTPLVYVAAGLVAALAGFLAVYATLGTGDNAVRTKAGRLEVASAPTGAPPATPAEPSATPAITRESRAAPTPASSNPLAQGHMALFVFKRAPEALPDITFNDGAGKPTTLKAWKGKVVLLNLWATWCGPCRKEMPSLDRLKRELGSDKFDVVALSLDRNGADRARKFLKDTKVDALALYNDPTARLGTALKAAGMPTTILIDKEGREIGRLTGPAEWDSEDARKLISAHLN
ncbi:MAG: TlpA family protein disulfide reductase [Hyphomicrobiaceae bacterium]|nr:TlpA family protein disulfide reductase [Hyphomicrobiaceae bacterium]